MEIPDKTIDHGGLRRLVNAGAQVGAEVVGGAGGWGVVICHGQASPPVDPGLRLASTTGLGVVSPIKRPTARAPTPPG